MTILRAPSNWLQHSIGTKSITCSCNHLKRFLFIKCHFINIHWVIQYKCICIILALLRCYGKNIDDWLKTHTQVKNTFDVGETLFYHLLSVMYSMIFPLNELHTSRYVTSRWGWQQVQTKWRVKINRSVRCVRIAPYWNQWNITHYSYY